MSVSYTELQRELFKRYPPKKGGAESLTPRQIQAHLDSLANPARDILSKSKNGIYAELEEMTGWTKTDVKKVFVNRDNTFRTEKIITFICELRDLQRQGADFSNMTVNEDGTIDLNTDEEDI